MQSALLPELLEDVVPLATEETLPSMPEEQSSIVMIEGVPAKLALKVEATKARGVEEEEGQALLLVKTIMKAIMLMAKTKLMMLL